MNHDLAPVIPSITYKAVNIYIAVIFIFYLYKYYLYAG